jgi:DNA modification methylase
MPEPTRDRCTKAHEYIFLFAKSARYEFNAEAIKEAATWKRENNPDWQRARSETNGKKHETNRNGKSGGFAGWSPDQGRNKRSVWTVSTRPAPKGAHFATFPPDLIEPCILAGSRPGDIVLDPFMGSGTTAAVAVQHGRQYIGCELNTDYEALQIGRISSAMPTPANDNKEAEESAA